METKNIEYQLERIADNLEKIHKQLCCLTKEGEYNCPLDEIATHMRTLIDVNEK